MEKLTVIGGGLAGSEAAWQAAQHGIDVRLYEMRPKVQTGAHLSAGLAELVCSNSLGSVLPDRAPGVLKEELHLLGSLLLEVARRTAVPAGGALAVDRDAFSEAVTQAITSHPHIELIREEITEIPVGPAIVASGPLTSPALSEAIARFIGQQHLYFYDAIAPIMRGETIDLEIAYRASRYGRGEQEAGDYINCPMNREEYEAFVESLGSAERIPLKEFELEVEKGVRAGQGHFFEGCLPVEILARRGREALAFGPLRPVGLVDPRTGQRPHAVVQLRQDNLAGSLYNLVGFQTNLTYPEQKRVFRMIPGLEKAEFERYGQMHRNTFIFSPALLEPSLRAKTRPDLFFAGQITGVEGYMGNIATGLLAGMNAARHLLGKPILELPPTTMLGALCHYITHASSADFQPMKANFGILHPILEGRGGRNRRERSRRYAERAITDMRKYIAEIDPELKTNPAGVD